MNEEIDMDKYMEFDKDTTSKEKFTEKISPFEITEDTDLIFTFLN